MFTCVIVDSDPHAIERLKKFIPNLPILTISATFTDSVSAMSAIKQMPYVDLLLLNAEMPIISGIELMKAIRHKIKKLIFTSNETKFAYDAFKVGADEYLLKSFSLGDFVIAVHKLFPVQVATALKEDFFFVKSKEDNSKLTKIITEEIIFIESKLNYVSIFLDTKKKVTTYITLTEIGKFLSHSRFMQVQRSFIVNKYFIESLYGNVIKMSNGSDIHIGNSYKSRLADFLKDKVIYQRAYKATGQT